MLHKVRRPVERAAKPTGAILEGSPHRVSARRQPPLVERHQEADGARAGILTLRCGSGALALHEARHVAVQIELCAVYVKVHGMRNTLREDLLGGPGAVL